MPRDSDSRLEPPLIGIYQCIGIVLAGQSPVRIVRHHRTGRSKTRSDIEVHQPAVQFGDRRILLPARSGIESKSGTDPPVIGEVGVVLGAGEFLSGLAE